MSFSKLPIDRRQFLTLTGVAAGGWLYPALAKNAENPLRRALAVWNMATFDAEGNRSATLIEKGKKGSFFAKNSRALHTLHLSDGAATALSPSSTILLPMASGTRVSVSTKTTDGFP